MSRSSPDSDRFSPDVLRRPIARLDLACCNIHGISPYARLVPVPDADWPINDLLATVESRLYIVSCERENPGTITDYFKQEDGARIEALRRALGDGALKLLYKQPGKTMAYEPLCGALHSDFFGQLKEGDYSKAIKQLVKDGRVRREQKSIRPKLLPAEKISLPS